MSICKNCRRELSDSLVDEYPERYELYFIDRGLCNEECAVAYDEWTRQMRKEERGKDLDVDDIVYRDQCEREGKPK